MSSKKRVNAYLEEDLWAHAKRSGNASAYVSAVLRDHLGRVRAARDYLTDAGWTRNEVLAAEAVEGAWLSSGASENRPVAPHAALKRNGTHERWGIAAKRWQKLIRSARDKERTADALGAIAEEMTERNHPVY